MAGAAEPQGESFVPDGIATSTCTAGVAACNTDDSQTTLSSNSTWNGPASDAQQPTAATKRAYSGSTPNVMLPPRAMP